MLRTISFGFESRAFESDPYTNNNITTCVTWANNYSGILRSNFELCSVVLTTLIHTLK